MYIEGIHIDICSTRAQVLAEREQGKVFIYKSPESRRNEILLSDRRIVDTRYINYYRSLIGSILHQMSYNANPIKE